MLDRVPLYNVIVSEYRNKPSSSAHPMTEEFQKILEELNNPKQGGKRKTKASSSDVVKTLKKKVKKVARIPRSPSPVLEESESQTQSDVRRNEKIQKDVEGTAATLKPLVSEPTPTD